MSRRLLTCSVVGLAVGLTTLPVAADAAARRPDLKVTAVSAPATIQTGAVLTVKVTTRNAGRKTARASTTRVHLSADAKPGGDLAVGTVKVKKLAAGKKRTATVRLLVPAGAAAAAYRVLACADAKKKVKETKKRNNCRVAKHTVKVSRPTTPPVDPPPSDSRFPQTPNPISVTPVMDETRSVTKHAPPHEDTTITATGEDGTTYTLSLPAGALIGFEQITLTPLASVTDLPLSGGLAAGVELKPHGLDLLKQGTLTIDSPNLGPLAQQTGFYFHEGGEDLHLYPVLPARPGDDANVVRMPVDHFSTPGIGWGTPADRGAMLKHPPTRDQGQIAAAVSDLLRAERERNPNGEKPTSPELGPGIEALMEEYYDGTLRPALQSAEDNPRALGLVRRSISDTLAWLRTMELFFGGDDGYSSARADDAKARIERVLDAVSDDLWKRCSQEHDLEALPLLLTLTRQVQLLGYSWAAEPDQRFKDCSRFELRFDSRINFNGTWPVGGEELYNYPHTGTGAWRAQATAISELVSGGFATVPLPLTEASYHSEYSYPRSDGTTCHGHSDQTGSTPGQLTAYAIPSFQANPRQVPPGEEAVETWEEPPVELLIHATPAQVRDQVHTVDCGGGDYDDDLPSRWLNQYHDFHEGDQPLRGAKADRSGDLMYAKTWNDTATTSNHLGGETWSETTVLEVWHKPNTG